jgi:hypothetical protein
MRFSQRWLWKVLSSGIWPRVVRWKSTDVSGDRYPFRLEGRRISRRNTSVKAGDKESSTCHLLSLWHLARLILWPWRWGLYVPSKRRLNFNELHGVIYQKIVHFNWYHDYRFLLKHQWLPCYQLWTGNLVWSGSGLPRCLVKSVRATYVFYINTDLIVYSFRLILL